MSLTLKVRFCPLCNENKDRNLYHPNHSPGPVVRCHNCGMVYVSPVEDNHSLIYDGPELHDLDQRLLNSNDLEDLTGCWEVPFILSKIEECAAESLKAINILDIIEKITRPPGRLMDFGCGSGFFLHEAKNRGWVPYGIEPLPGHAVYVRAKFGACVVNDTLRDDTFPPNYFDVVTAIQVFEHLPDPAENLFSIYKVLKPGGVIFIEVPNINTWSVRLFGKHHRHFTQDHLNFFSKRTIVSFLKKQHFQLKGIYFPARNVTMRYMIRHWCQRYLPKSLVDLMEVITKRLGLWEMTVNINIGDILSVIAIKD